MLQGILKPMVFENLSYEVHHHGPLAIPRAGIRFVVDDDEAQRGELEPGDQRHTVTCYFDKKKREAGVFEVPALETPEAGGRYPLASQVKGTILLKKDESSSDENPRFKLAVLDRIAYEDLRQHFGRRINCEPLGGTADHFEAANKVAELERELERQRGAFDASWDELSRRHQETREQGLEAAAALEAKHKELDASQKELEAARARIAELEAAAAQGSKKK